jgi:hypothetical protein
MVEKSGIEPKKDLPIPPPNIVPDIAIPGQL